MSEEGKKTAYGRRVRWWGQGDLGAALKARLVVPPLEKLEDENAQGEHILGGIQEGLDYKRSE